MSRSAAPARNQQTGCSVDGKRVHAGDEPVDQADERFAVGDVAGAIDQRVLSSDQVKRHERAEIACVHRHPFTHLGRQLGRRADKHRDVVPGGERLAKHVATERPGGAKDKETGHHNPPG